MADLDVAVANGPLSSRASSAASDAPSISRIPMQSIEKPGSAGSVSMLDEIAHDLRKQGKDLEAIKFLERSYELKKMQSGPTSSETRKAAEVLCIRSNVTAMMLLKESDDTSASFQLLKKAETIMEDPELNGNHPSAEWHCTQLKISATTMNNMGCLFRRRGKLHAALHYLDRALSIEERAFSINGPTATDNPAATHLNLCAVLSQLGRHLPALEHAKSALQLLHAQQTKANSTPRQLHPPASSSSSTSSSSNSTLSMMAVAYHNLAVEQEFLRDLQGAVDSYERAVEVSSRDLGARHPTTLSIQKSCTQAKANFAAEFPERVAARQRRQQQMQPESKQKKTTKENAVTKSAVRTAIVQQTKEQRKQMPEYEEDGFESEDRLLDEYEAVSAADSETRSEDNGSVSQRGHKSRPSLPPLSLAHVQQQQQQQSNSNNRGSARGSARSASNQYMTPVMEKLRDQKDAVKRIYSSSSKPSAGSGNNVVNNNNNNNKKPPVLPQQTPRHPSSGPQFFNDNQQIVEADDDSNDSDDNEDDGDDEAGSDDVVYSSSSSPRHNSNNANAWTPNTRKKKERIQALLSSVYDEDSFEEDEDNEDEDQDNNQPHVQRISSASSSVVSGSSNASANGPGGADPIQFIEVDSRTKSTIVRTIGDVPTPRRPANHNNAVSFEDTFVSPPRGSGASAAVARSIINMQKSQQQQMQKKQQPKAAPKPPISKPKNPAITDRAKRQEAERLKAAERKVTLGAPVVIGNKDPQLHSPRQPPPAARRYLGVNYSSIDELDVDISAASASSSSVNVSLAQRPPAPPVNGRPSRPQASRPQAQAQVQAQVQLQQQPKEPFSSPLSSPRAKSNGSPLRPSPPKLPKSTAAGAVNAFSHHRQQPPTKPHPPPPSESNRGRPVARNGRSNLNDAAAASKAAAADRSMPLFDGQMIDNLNVIPSDGISPVPWSNHDQEEDEEQAEQEAEIEAIDQSLVNVANNVAAFAQSRATIAPSAVGAMATAVGNNSLQNSFNSTSSSSSSSSSSSQSLADSLRTRQEKKKLAASLLSLSTALENLHSKILSDDAEQKNDLNSNLDSPASAASASAASIPIIVNSEIASSPPSISVSVSISSPASASASSSSSSSPSKASAISPKSASLVSSPSSSSPVSASIPSVPSPVSSSPSSSAAAAASAAPELTPVPPPSHPSAPASSYPLKPSFSFSSRPKGGPLAAKQSQQLRFSDQSQPQLSSSQVDAEKARAAAASVAQAAAEELERKKKIADELAAAELAKEKKEQENAAIKIQSSFKGHKARKEYEQKVLEKKKEQEEQAKVAVMMQASFRGRKTRQQLEEEKQKRSLPEQKVASPVASPKAATELAAPIVIDDDDDEFPVILEASIIPYDDKRSPAILHVEAEGEEQTQEDEYADEEYEEYIEYEDDFEDYDAPGTPRTPKTPGGLGRSRSSLIAPASPSSSPPSRSAAGSSAVSLISPSASFVSPPAPSRSKLVQ